MAAAAAIAAGWAAARPADTLVLAPQSDGGPGFVDVLAERLGGLQTGTVRGPLDRDVTAHWVLHADTAYIECAQAWRCWAGRPRRGPRSTPPASGWGNWWTRR